MAGLGSIATPARMTSRWFGNQPASGINNAVARVGGVLAIAVLGIVMVNAFGTRLDSKLANFSLPPGTLHEIQAGEIKLAGLQLPASLNPSTGAGIRESVREAF